MTSDVIERIAIELSRVDRPQTAESVWALLDLDEAHRSQVAPALEALASEGRVARWPRGGYSRAPIESVLLPSLRKLLESAPRTRSELTDALDGPLRLEPPQMRAVLTALVRKQALYSDDDVRLFKGSDRGIRFYASDPVQALAKDLVPLVEDTPINLDTLLRSLRPRPAKKLAVRALQALVRDGRMYSWRKGDRQFASRQAPKVIVQAELEAALAQGPAPESTLVRRLPGSTDMNRNVLRGVLKTLVREKHLYRFRVEKKTVYGDRHQAVRRALEDIEKSYGLTEDDLRASLGAAPVAHAGAQAEPVEPAGRPEGMVTPQKPPGHDVPDQTQPSSANDLWSDIERLAQQSQLSVLSIFELRQLSRLRRDDIDRALLQLSREDRITLYEHDYPPGLSEELREALLQDDRGRSFNSFIIRNRS